MLNQLGVKYLNGWSKRFFDDISPIKQNLQLKLCNVEQLQSFESILQGLLCLHTLKHGFYLLSQKFEIGRTFNILGNSLLDGANSIVISFNFINNFDNAIPQANLLKLFGMKMFSLFLVK